MSFRTAYQEGQDKSDQVVRMLNYNSLHQSDARLTSLAFARGDCREDLQGDAVIWRVTPALNMVIHTSTMAVAENRTQE